MYDVNYIMRIIEKLLGGNLLAKSCLCKCQERNHPRNSGKYFRTSRVLIFSRLSDLNVAKVTILKSIREFSL